MTNQIASADFRRWIDVKDILLRQLVFVLLGLWVLSLGAFGQACSNTGYGNGFRCIQNASSFNGGTTNTSTSVGLPAGVSAGDTIIVAVEAAFAANGQVVSSVMDSLGNTYTAIPSSVNTHCAHNTEWFYASHILGGSDTVTANFGGDSSGGGTVAAMEWSGVGVFDVAGLDNNSGCPWSNTATTASITTGNAVDLILAFFVDTSGAESITAGSGFTLVDSYLGAADHGIEAVSVSSAHSYDASFTLGGPVNWETNIVAFKAAISGPGSSCSNTGFGNGFTCIQEAGSFNGGTTAFAVSAALVSDVTSGNTIIVATEASTPANGEFVNSVTDNLGNIFTAIPSSVNSDCAHYIEWFYASNIIGGTDTVTANFSGYANGGGGSVVAMEWSGVGAFDVGGPDGNRGCPWSSTVTTAPITTSNPTDLLLGFFVDTSGAGSIAPGNGDVLIDTLLAADDHGVEAQSVSSTGSYPATFSLQNSADWEADIVAFTAAGSGGGNSNPTLVSIAVTPASFAISVGNTGQFSAMGTYSDGSQQNLTSTASWTSSATAVATVGSSGLADGVGPGQSTIEAALGGVNGSAALTVIPAGSGCFNTSYGNGFTCMQAASNVDGGTVNTSVSAALPFSVTAGHSILVATEAAFPGLGEFVTSVTDNLGNTYAAIPSSVSTHCAHYTEWFYASTVLGGSVTVTANFSGYANGGGGTVSASEWSGVGVYDVAGLDGNSTCPWSNIVATAPTTTSNATDLIVGFFVDTSGAGSIAAGNGFTLIDKFLGAADHAVEAEAVSSIGSYDATFTLGDSVNWEADLVAFTAAGSNGGGGTNPTLVSIAVTPANPSIIAGTTEQFKATGTYSDGSQQNLTGTVSWTSSATPVATINNNGLANGAGSGQTTIEAASGGISGSTTMTVAPAGTDCADTSYGNGFNCIQAASNFDGGTFNTSVSTVLPFSVTSGDSILVATEAAFPGMGEIVSSVIDNLGNTYVAVPSSVNTHCTHYIEWFYSSNVTGGSVTVTANFSGYTNGGGGTVAAMEWSGVGTVDVAGLDGNNNCPWSDVVTTSAISTMNSVDLLLAFFVDTSGGQSITPGIGFTLINSFLGAADHGVEAEVVSSTGNYDATFVLGNSVNWETDIIAFKAAP